MHPKEFPRPQLERLYVVCEWVTRTLEQPINIVSYMERSQVIYVQIGQLKQRRAFYIRPNGNVSPNWST